MSTHFVNSRGIFFMRLKSFFYLHIKMFIFANVNGQKLHKLFCALLLYYTLNLILCVYEELYSLRVFRFISVCGMEL